MHLNHDKALIIEYCFLKLDEVAKLITHDHERGINVTDLTQNYQHTATVIGYKFRAG